MRPIWMAATVVALAFGFCVQAEDTRRNKDTSKMVGTWTVTSQQTDGKRAAATDIADRKVKITRDTIVCSGKDGKSEMACRYEIDTGSVPWGITMTCTEGEHKGKKLKGIADLEGDTLRVCFAKPDGDAPTKFEAKENQCCMTLKRNEK